ncbi:hemin uptake protein HemP [Roseiconus lacunae]|uniref:Hemin uptake protein HemP n=1 Tax=Roseiconus lacunae TaxID=2605694 RepID=A0ABT7PHF7_9BACT|nr:hemin uptake protein HemP [Roseiconus lacunae]MCD0461158.1 hemin uptake protein HemP [Roseiconus lacunae]MDM4015920.1 hemin uptake protein HemP [Roseiconus lacunae]WRQ51742.1 hemin uptake protein HemP [Stieleria sp. HD01]
MNTSEKRLRVQSRHEETDDSISPSLIDHQFDQLSGGKSEVKIWHEGQCYSLKRTKAGRLVLHK